MESRLHAKARRYHIFIVVREAVQVHDNRWPCQLVVWTFSPSRRQVPRPTAEIGYRGSRSFSAWVAVTASDELTKDEERGEPRTPSSVGMGIPCDE